MRVRASPVTLFEHAAYLAAAPGDAEPGKLLVSATVKLIGVDSSGKVARIPPAVLDHFRKLL
jgi:acyl-CoA thioesterase FadM